MLGPMATPAHTDDPVVMSTVEEPARAWDKSSRNQSMAVSIPAEHRMRLGVAMTRILLLLCLAACSGEPTPPPNPEPVAEPPQAVTPWPAPGTATDTRYAASHILLAYRGAVRAPAGTARTASEAQKMAEQLFGELEEGADFEALAATHSADPNAPRGGRIGTFLTGTMMPSFEAAVAGVEPGQFTVAETPFGWHVIRRDPVVHYRARHIVVGFAGAHESSATRSKQEAHALIAEADERLSKGESFEDLARELSEGPSASSGGDLGGFGSGQMIPAFEDAVRVLEPGRVSGAIETPFGVHLVQRIE